VPQKPMSMEKELSRQKPFIFLQHNHLLLLFSFSFAIGQIYPSTFRMSARLGCMVLLSIRSGDTRRNTVTEFTCCSIRVASRKVIYPAC
jgi:hypothetical protein